jgi:chorismate synthase
MLRYLSAGESHGKCLSAIIEGLPSGLRLDEAFINAELKRRLAGYGRGPRSKGIENDKVEFLSGIRNGLTLGSPLALIIKNKDFSIDKLAVISKPRPGHADLPGALKYNQNDIRNILERASARETAARTAVGAIAKTFLNNFQVIITSHVIALGGVDAHTKGLKLEDIMQRAENSDLRCADKAAEKLMKEEISKIENEGDTLGGVFEVIISGVCPGIGSFVHYDRKLDAALTSALMSIQAIKGVEVGLGFEVAKKAGSQVHDEIFYDKKKGFYRKTNNAGGIEGGMSNGEPIIMRCAMKPIPTLQKALESVDIKSKEKFKAQVERSDITAVPAAAVVAEAAVAFELAKLFIEKFGGDSVGETSRNYKAYLQQIKGF